MRDPKVLLALVEKQVKRFSEKSLRSTFGFSDEETAAVIDLAGKQDHVAEYLSIECPSCGNPCDTIKNTQEKIDQLESPIVCDECSTEFTFENAEVYKYLQFTTSKKKVPASSPRTVALDNIPESIKRLKGKSVSEITKSDADGLIWHISDPHFGSGGFGNPGHDVNLVQSFESLVSSRSNKNDILLITGDCTTNGREAEFKSFNSFLERVKTHFKEHHIIPGNHDGWDSFNFLTVFFKNILRRVLKFFYIPLSHRRGTAFDDHINDRFKERPYYLCDITWAKRSIKFIFVDTTIRNQHAIAQGVFPDRRELADAYHELANTQYDFAILALHHHVIRYFEPINNNYQFIKHDLSMRLRNADEAKRFIKTINIKLILHGHKHFKEKEIMLTNDGQTMFCAAPAAFLKSDKSTDNVGFNLFFSKNNRRYLANILYQDGYIIDDITQLEV